MNAYVIEVRDMMVTIQDRFVVKGKMYKRDDLCGKKGSTKSFNFHSYVEVHKKEDKSLYKSWVNLVNDRGFVSISPKGLLPGPDRNSAKNGRRP